MRRQLMIAAALLAAAGLANAGQLACLPANVPGGMGTYAVVSVNPRGYWAGWWCPTVEQPQILAVTRDQLTSTHQVLLAYAASGQMSLGDINDVLSRIGGDVNGPVLKPVWYPERDKLNGLRYPK